MIDLINGLLNRVKVENVIAAIERNPKPDWEFTPTRYPYTYAYDYLRSHSVAFGLADGLSRGDCAVLFRDQPDKFDVCVLLAEAYLREWSIVR